MPIFMVPADEGQVPHAPCAHICPSVTRGKVPQRVFTPLGKQTPCTNPAKCRSFLAPIYCTEPLTALHRFPIALFPLHQMCMPTDDWDL